MSSLKALGAVLCLIFALSFAAPNAYADTVTLIVSGSLSPGLNAACSGSGCTLGGDIVIDNTTGAVISVDVTISGESPSVGPFTVTSGIFAPAGGTLLTLGDGNPFNSLRLVLTTPTQGSLVGYDGGPIQSLTGSLILSFNPIPSTWNLTSGALTPVTPTPEPSSLALMLSGVGLVFATRKRFSGLQQAS
jgi:hypothetical protein